MLLNKSTLVILLSVVFVACAKTSLGEDASDTVLDGGEEPTPQSNVQTSDPARVGPYGHYPQGVILDEVLIMATENSDPSDIELVAANIGGTVIGRIPSIRLYQIQFANDENLASLLDDALLIARSSPSVLAAAPNAILSSFQYPDDGYAWDGRNDDCACGEAWTDTNIRNQVWGQWAVRLPAAWSTTVGNPAFTVGVVDVSIPASSIDLSRVHVAYAGKDGVIGDHGTGVTSILAAEGNNGVGIAGVNWVSPVRYYQIEFNPTDKYVTLVMSMASITRAIQDNVKLLNISVGISWYSIGVFPSDDETYQDGPDANWLEEQKDIWRPVLKLAEAQKVLIVAAAGNNSNPAIRRVHPKWSGGLQALRDEYPNNIIIVAAVGSPDALQGYFSDWADRWWGLTPFSSDGNSVDIAAPGAKILSLSGCRGSGGDLCVGYLDGTSIAAPFVTGTASLVWGLKPEMSPGDVKTLLLKAARIGGHRVFRAQLLGLPDVNASYYVLDAGEAIRLALEWNRSSIIEGKCVDSDGDGYGQALTDGSVPSDCLYPRPDCDDTIAEVHPGAVEICNEKDDNCNGHTDEEGACCHDTDEDGVPAIECGGTDCDDYRNTVFPDAPELCDGLDNDCNGQTDDVTTMRISSDPENCGSCGHVCTSSSPYCYKSACHVEPPCVSVCTAGTRRCDQQAIQLCTLLSDDCTHWVTETTCGSGTSCEDANCVNTPVCGDGVCWGESCNSCPADCKSCGCSGGGGFCGGPGEYKCVGRCAYRCDWDQYSEQSTWKLITDCSNGGSSCQCALIDGWFFYCGYNGDPYNPCASN